MEFTNTVTIHREVADVFAFLEDFENVPKWNYAIVETRKTSPGPVGMGSTYEQTRSLPKEAKEAFEVIMHVRDQKLAIRGNLGPFYGVVTYEFEQVPEGTLLINSANLEAHGLSRVLSRLGGERVRQAVSANLERLKQILEA